MCDCRNYAVSVTFGDMFTCSQKQCVRVSDTSVCTGKDSTCIGLYYSPTGAARKMDASERVLVDMKVFD